MADEMEVKERTVINVIRAGDDPGFCREYFRRDNGWLYCEQLDWRNKPPNLYRCTLDGEPWYEVDYELNIVESF